MELQHGEILREYIGHDFIIDSGMNFIIYDICNNDEYQINCFNADTAPRTIVDVGAHVGVFTKLCLQRFPHSKIIAFEPHPRSFELLKHNLEVAGLYDESKVRLVNAAIGPKNILCAPEGNERIRLMGFDSRGGTVPVITVENMLTMCDDFFKTKQMGLLKVDAEGCEYYLLPELRRKGRMPDVGFIRGEAHWRPRNFQLDSAMWSTHRAAFYADFDQLCKFVAHRESPSGLRSPVVNINPSIELLREPTNKHCILTMMHGEFTKFDPLTIPPLKYYAKRHKLDFQIAKPIEIPGKPLTFAELQLTKLTAIREALKLYKRVAWIDSDILVRSDTPNLFDLVSENRYGGVDELSLYRKYGHPGECNLRVMSVCEVCYEDEVFPPNSIDYYFNCGVQVVSQDHKPLFEPALHPHEDTWCEQNRINARLIVGKYPVNHLPESFNQMYRHRDLTYRKTGYLLHYCGADGTEAKIATCRSDLDEWRTEYPYSG